MLKDRETRTQTAPLRGMGRNYIHLETCPCSITAAFLSFSSIASAEES